MPNCFFTRANAVSIASFLILILSGCSSISKGIAEALLEKTENIDNRVCQVWGSSFEGMAPKLNQSVGRNKLLMVHGVGDHIPGYSTQFLEKLARELKLTSRLGHPKDITLINPRAPDKVLGNLRATHLLNETTGQRLTFYELTWSVITRQEKSLLDFDNSGEYAFRRAKVNDMLKKFSNDTGPDPIIYLGKSRELILSAFTQSFCWMSAYDWEELPDNTRQPCIGLNDNEAHVINDNYAFVSHSLGSRIVIDGLQRIATILPKLESYLPEDKKGVPFTKRIESFKSKRIPIFMLSNQLPMLQMGLDLPEVAGHKEDYCLNTSPRYSERMISETAIFAFSDPNDLLSYAIPNDFSERFLDSRLCPTITNININVTKVIDAFGISDLANPLEAHVAYDQDDRVIALIARGIGTELSSPLVQERCEFTKIIQ
ncbi:MAG: hypothetical protein CTY19_16620 [Methylomonas sp.]|jgi:hypothetical protein|nr:MAG: hypothetical protein CTY19_16620 [Methylomonas sp.]